MALEKTISYKGEDYSYWTIMSYVWVKPNIITGRLGLFRNKAAKEANLQNEIADENRGFEVDYSELKAALPASIRGLFKLGADPILAALYPLIKESRKITVEISPAVPEIKAEDDTVIQEGKEAVTQEVETNFFADATDI